MTSHVFQSIVIKSHLFISIFQAVILPFFSFIIISQAHETHGVHIHLATTAA